MPDPNLALLEDAVHKLTPFLNEIVFVGGAILGILISDPAAAPIRGTTDVDVIAEIFTYADYMAFSERLRAAGFKEDEGERPLACRWHHGTLILDVLALDAKVLGFSNLWYPAALKNAEAVILPSGRRIHVITAPFFLGTKMEAFRNRGNLDYQASHDLEDFIAVVEGRGTLLEEIENAPHNLRTYLAEAAQFLRSQQKFMDVLPGFVVDHGRVPLVEDRLQRIATNGTAA